MEVSDQLTTVFSGTFTSTYWNIGLQIVCKAMTFVLNWIIVRYISPDLIGIVNMRLLLLHTTILFLCREGVRRACTGNLQQNDWKQTVNLIWLSTASSVVVSSLLSVVWVCGMEAPENYGSYGFGVFAYSISATIDMFAEPFYLTAQEFMFHKLRVMAKFISLLIQASLNAVLIIVAPQLGILIFSSTQILGAFINSAIFFLYFSNFLQQPKNQIQRNIQLPIESMWDFLPSQTSPLLPDRLRHVAWSFTKQSFMKQILTEGEKLIMTGLQMLTFAGQGVYDIINNLGSLVARLFFQQIEENAYVLFAKVLPRERDQLSQNQKNDSEAFGAKMLEVYLKTITAFSLIIVIFGYNYSEILLFLYGGKNLSTGDGPILMRAYWIYVLFMAVNGVTEAFVFSAMTKVQVDRYNKKLVGFSLAFLASTLALVKWFGAVGFIIANSLNMALRIAHSVLFIRQYYQHSTHNPLRGVLVNKKFLLACTAITAFLPVARSYCDLQTWSGVASFVSFGAGLGLSLLIILWKTESELIIFLTKLLSKKELKMSKKNSADICLRVVFFTQKTH